MPRDWAMDDTVEAVAMNGVELFEIVKNHREAWPEDVEYHPPRHDSYSWSDKTCGGFHTRLALLAFEASFHRKLADGRDVLTMSMMAGGIRAYQVQVDDHDFYAVNLIEAYAKALEWLK
jgi:hypothetical protein